MITAKIYVLYNSKSGNGNGGKESKKVENFFKGKEFEYVDITKLKDYNEFLSALAGSDGVVICGGDGTLSRFANDTYDIEFDRDIYYFATGSGNDFFHDVSDKTEPEPIVVNQYIKNLPTVNVKGKTYRFINGVGYGIDGYCCEVGDKLRGQNADNKPINYTSIAVKGLLFHYKPTDAVVTVDGKEYRYKKVWLAPTMNGRRYGGGMIPTPDQKRIADDKLVSVMIMNGAGKLRTLIAFPTIFEGKHVEKKMTSIHSGKSIKVSFDRPTALQIDGETILGVKEYEVNV